MTYMYVFLSNLKCKIYDYFKFREFDDLDYNSKDLNKCNDTMK